MKMDRKVKVRAKSNIFSDTLGVVKTGDVLEVTQEEYDKYKSDFELIAADITVEVPKNVVKKKSKKDNKGTG